MSRSEVLRSNVVAVLVVDSQGDPLPGATVKSTGFTEGSTVVLGGSRPTSSSDEAVAGADGVARLRVYDVRRNDQAVIVSPPLGSGDAARRVVLPEGVRGDVELDVRLQAGRAVRGSVVDRDGRPVAGLRLELSSASHFALVWTDDQGRYAAALPDGAYSVYGRVSEYSGLYNLPDYTSFFGSLVVAGDVSRSEVLRF